MGEVIRLDAAARNFPAPLTRPTHQMPYETYLAYQQAEAAFRALYFGRPLDIETMTNRPSAKIVQRHWAQFGASAPLALGPHWARPRHAAGCGLHDIVWFHRPDTGQHDRNVTDLSLGLIDGDSLQCCQLLRRRLRGIEAGDRQRGDTYPTRIVRLFMGFVFREDPMASSEEK